MCPSCGTYYEYDQVYDPGELVTPSSTNWTLRRLTPHQARSYLDRIPAYNTPNEREVLERRFPHIIESLRSDASRVQEEADLGIKKYVIDALREYYLLTSGWDALKTTLAEHPDPEVRVRTATWLLHGAQLALEKGCTDDISTALFTVLTLERKQFLVGVLAEGLSHDRKILGDWASASASGLSMYELGLPFPLSLRPAVPALVALLRESSCASWCREEAGDVLVTYVGKERRRAQAMLEGLAGVDTEEVRVVRRHCQKVLDEE
jgi:hypothetical protein